MQIFSKPDDSHLRCIFNEYGAKESINLAEYILKNFSTHTEACKLALCVRRIFSQPISDVERNDNYYFSTTQPEDCKENMEIPH